jgi:hypothetical protein
MFLLLCLFILYFLSDIAQRLGTLRPVSADHALRELHLRRSFPVVTDTHRPFLFTG